LVRYCNRARVSILKPVDVNNDFQIPMGKRPVPRAKPTKAAVLFGAAEQAAKNSLRRHGEGHGFNLAVKAKRERRG
jgi:hypothetical protein